MHGFNFHAASSHVNAHLNHSRSVSDAKAEARKASTDVEILEDEVERMYMVIEALWGMVKESGKFTDDDLIERVAEIDLRDGKLDGRASEKTAPPICPSCSRTMKRHRPQCLYCGTMVLQHPFEK
jgi:hypothetical protein